MKPVSPRSAKNHHTAQLKAKAMKKYPKQKQSHFGIKRILLTLVIFYVLYLGLSTFDSAARDAQKFDPLSFLWNLGSDITIQDQKTNILLLGYGGKGHDGPLLTDTVMLASIHHGDSSVSLLSLPRDLYVKPEVNYASKLNAVYSSYQKLGHNKAINTTKDVIETITGMPVHYHVMVDFKSFEKVVDTLWGLMINNPHAFVDHRYPTKDKWWKTIRFQKWTQTLYGERALQFARSRHASGKEGWDFARGHRQQLILKAFQEKFLSENVLSSPSRIKELFDIASEYVKTDLWVKEVLALGKMARNMDDNSIVMHSLSDDTYSFLYSPDIQTTGLYVLKPKGGDFYDIHKFLDIAINHPNIYKEGPKIRVLNGTDESGLATSCMQKLERYNIPVYTIGNSSADRSYKETWVYDHTSKEYPATLGFLPEFVGGVEVSHTYETKPTQADISIIIGEEHSCDVSSLQAAK